MIKRLSHFSYSVLIITVMVILYFTFLRQNVPNAEILEGFTDVSRIDFLGEDKFVTLDGEWLCYPGTYMAPDMLDDTDLTPVTTLIPSYLSELSESEEEPCTCATYSVTLHTDGTPGYYAIRTDLIYTNYEVFVGTHPIYSSYKPGTEYREYYPAPQVITFYSDVTDITVTICVKNTSHPYGGIGGSVYFGSSDSLNRYRNGSLAMSILICGMWFTTFLFHLLNYIVDRKDRVLLFFSLLCFFTCIRCLIRYEVILTMLFPQLSYTLGSMIHYSILPLMAMCAIHFLNAYYPGNLPKFLLTVLTTGTVMFSLCVFFSSPAFYIPIYPQYIACVSIVVVVGIYMFSRALVKGYPGAMQFAIGGYMFILGTVLEIANYFNNIKSLYAIAVGMSGYIALQTLALVRKKAKLRRDEATLYYEQQEALDRARLIRNDYLSSQMKPHFLYNTLNNIAENCYSDPETAKKLIAALKEYMQSTLQLDARTNMCNIKEELELVHAYTFIEETRFKGLIVEYELPDPLPSVKVPMLSLQPLVENAIKHGVRRQPENGKVIVRIEEAPSQVLFTVMDTGVGMTEEQIQKLFHVPTGNKSIGLYNIDVRLRELYGSGLHVVSAPGQGTTISFKIPVY